MLTPYERLTLYALLDSGISVAEISRRTGKSVGTIQKYRKAKGLRQSTEAKPNSISLKISPVKEFIDAQMKKGRVNVVKLFRQVRLDGYRGSYGLLNSYVRTHTIYDKHFKPTERVNHDPGYQAQMDWGSFGKIIINGESRRLYAFLYVLCYSRALYVEFVVKQNLTTLESCHKNAFEKLGIPKAIRYDNMKPVVINREKLQDGSTRIHYNPEFFNFANHYGFEVEVCKPYYPQSKGKVEAAVKYLRYNFMSGEEFGKTFYSLNDINDKVREWVDKVANQRIHRATQQRPIDLWQKERSLLRFPDSIPSFTTQPFMSVRVSREGIVQHKTNFYEFPKELAGKKIFIRQTEHQGIPKLEGYHEDVLIYTHTIPNERGKMVAMQDSRSDAVRGSLKSRTRRKHITKKLDINVPSRNLDYYDSLIQIERS